jgi:hypothetical protein
LQLERSEGDIQHWQLQQFKLILSVSSALPSRKEEALSEAKLEESTESASEAQMRMHYE